MNILHANTDPTLLTRLRQMLAHAASADIAVGYLFVSGFNAVADELAKPSLKRVRILVGRADRATIEEVARGMQQAEALRSRVEGDELVRRSARRALGAEAPLAAVAAEDRRPVRVLRAVLARAAQARPILARAGPPGGPPPTSAWRSRRRRSCRSAGPCAGSRSGGARRPAAAR